jgi:hypothetical protein
MVGQRASWPGQGASGSDRPPRRGAADHPFGTQPFQRRGAVESYKSSDRYPSVGDDDVAASTGSIEPLAEVGTKFGHGDVHTATVH